LRRNWQLKLIWNSSINVLFKERKQRKVEPCTFGIKASFYFLGLEYRSIVDQSMVVEEKPASDVEGNEDINTVVFMGSKNEEDSKTVAEPSEGMKKEDSSGGILSDEEVKKSEADCVAREHVVSTRSHSLETHPRS